MNHSSAGLLTQNIKSYLAHLAVLREFQQGNENPYFKSALIPAIEDAQEAIARVASRLRQLGFPLLDQTPDEAGQKLLRQARNQRSVEEKLKFVRHWLRHQLEWYSLHVKELKNDADSQATLVALAEQTRVRLERWENLMKELKVPVD
jgi:penicillin V acylase-like amidase (Ntn superfamily)